MNSKLFRWNTFALACGLFLLVPGVGISAPKAPTKPITPATEKQDTMEKINQSIDESVKKIKETLRIEPGKNDTPANEARVSRLANDAVTKIEAAQSSIEANKLPEAKTQLSQAQELLDNIQQTGPTAKVIDKVQTTRKQLETSQTATMDLVPLESELATFETVTPAPKAKEHLNLAKKSLQENKKGEASQHLSEVEDQLIYAEADLPVARTKQDVLSAQTLLNQNKPKEAHKALTDSLMHIQTLIVEADGETKAKMPTSVPKK